VQWEFHNPSPNQELTIRIDGSVVRHEVVALGRHAGQVSIPASAAPTELTFEFARAIKPVSDPRRITATFYSLRIALP
jgi:hypothetical protein